MSVRDRSTGARFWATPVLSVVLGIVFLVTGWQGGNLGLGLFGLVLMLVCAAAMAVAGKRFETMREVLVTQDERVASISQVAAARTGHILILAILIGYFVEISRGHPDSPFTWLGALAGVTFAGNQIIGLLRR